MDPAMQLEVVAMSRQQIIRDASALGDSDVQRFYCGRVVFLTGGSGFLGKQLIEKLLRSCKPRKIYMMLRSKRGKSTEERLESILQDPVFDSLRQQQPDFASKIVTVAGDVGEIKLGLSDEVWKMLTEEVDIIFHVAAVTKFDETLRMATLINVRGTRECLTLGKACKKLRSYVHVSTAYSHATTVALESKMKIEEAFYKAPIPADTMISLAENLDDDRLINITEKLIKNWPNTYTFTKAIAEDLVRSSSEDLHICVVRPGVVVCTYSEPMPGWMDMSCIYGASGFLIGIGMGVLHIGLVDPVASLGIVPCDMVNNTIIVAGKETAEKQTKGGDDTQIYTVTSVKRNPINWNAQRQVLESIGRNIPTPSAIYYNFGLDTNNFVLFTIGSWFMHIIPAYIADFVCLLIGKERRFAKLAKKVCKMSKVLSYFLINNFDLDDQNTEKLFNSLSKADQVIFNHDITSINWLEYMTIWIIGCRKYILKDGLKNTEYAIKKQKYLRVAHYFLTILYLYGIWKLISFVFYAVSVLFYFVIN